LAQAAGAELLQSKFENFAQQRNAALDALQTDWVFFVDADERGTPELGQEIRQVIATPAGARLVRAAPQLHLWPAHARRGLVP
jgi:glycosyltransferase involved in cell wall biosynthesis